MMLECYAFVPRAERHRFWDSEILQMINFHHANVEPQILRAIVFLYASEDSSSPPAPWRGVRLRNRQRHSGRGKYRTVRMTMLCRTVKTLSVTFVMWWWWCSVGMRILCV